jgi:uncharacterized protein YuzE
MAKVTVHYDAEGGSLTVWFGSPQAEASCEEIGDDAVVMKDAEGHIIGVEKLNVSPGDGAHSVSVEVLPADALAKVGAA